MSVTAPHRRPRAPRRPRASWRRGYASLALLVLPAVVGVALFTRDDASAAVKPPIQGVIDRRFVPPESKAQVVDGFVIKVDWAELQPTREPGTDHGGPLVTKTVDDALVEARRRGLTVKLRVHAGIGAPEWLKSLDGAPMPWHDPRNGAQVGTIGRFWSPTFGEAYRDLQSQLAARYDREPLLRDVVISRCTTYFAEPFLRQYEDERNLDHLADAGYTVAADQQCHREQIDVHADLWRTTRSSLDVQSFQRLNDETFDRRDNQRDLAFAEEMMRYCRERLAERCVLGNNGLSESRASEGHAYHDLYQAIARMGPPIYFQTATPEKIGDWRLTLRRGVELGANAIELPDTDRGYISWPLTQTVTPDGSVAQGLDFYDALLEANPFPGGPDPRRLLGPRVR